DAQTARLPDHQGQRKDENCQCWHHPVCFSPLNICLLQCEAAAALSASHELAAEGHCPSWRPCMAKVKPVPTRTASSTALTVRYETPATSLSAAMADAPAMNEVRGLVGFGSEVISTLMLAR